MNKLQWMKLDEEQSRYRLIGAQNTKSSNISAAFPTAPKLLGRIQDWRAVQQQLGLVLIVDGVELC